MKRALFIGVLMWPNIAAAQYIDGLPAATSAAPTDLVIVCQGGTPGKPGTCTTKQASISQATILQGYTIATLPACSSTTKGTLAYVTNGVTSPVYNATVGATGSTVVPVFCTGAVWTYH